jgi:hypothetical protein
MKIKRNLIVSEVSTSVEPPLPPPPPAAAPVDDDDDEKTFSFFTRCSPGRVLLIKGFKNEAENHSFRALVSQAILVITVLCRFAVPSSSWRRIKIFPRFHYTTFLSAPCSEAESFVLLFSLYTFASSRKCSSVWRLCSVLRLFPNMKRASESRMSH